MLLDHLALNVRQVINSFHMVAHSVDILPASHRIGADAGMCGAKVCANVFRGAARSFPHAILNVGRVVARRHECCSKAFQKLCIRLRE